MYSEMKKILMILHDYPPRNTIGVYRNLYFSKYLLDYGWQPIIITEDWAEENSMAIPEEITVYRTSRKNSNGISSTAISSTRIKQNKIVRFAKDVLKYWYKEVFQYPDDVYSSRYDTIKLCREVIKKEKPDLIYSSAKPVTSHIVASKLCEEFNLPWVADFRDLWTQGTYVKHTFLRQFFERRLEKSCIANADRLITVSQPLAEQLEELHQIKCSVITNGFEPSDFPKKSKDSSELFTISYTGQLYSGKRNPKPLFDAVEELIQEGKIDTSKFQINFYGTQINELPGLDEYNNLDQVLNIFGKVNYREALDIQQSSTILLQVNAKTTIEKGVYTGKLFEYLGAKRPVLAIPKIGGVVDELLTETNAGIVADNKSDIKLQIEKWYKEFINTGKLEYKGDDDTISNYTRRNKCKELSVLLNEII